MGERPRKRAWALTDDVGILAKYKAWLCAAVRCQFGFVAEPDIRAARDHAIAAFQSAIELKPENADAWLRLANLYGSQEQYDQAISSAKEATRLAPGDFRGWFFLGSHYTETGSYPQARDASQRGEKLVPSEEKSWLVFVGLQYAKMRDREQVLRIYHKLKVSDPKMAERFFTDFVLPRPDERPAKQQSPKR